MKRRPDQKPNVWDGAAALAVLALAVLCALLLRRGAAGGALTAAVSIDGAEAERFTVEELRESGEKTYSHNGFTLTVTADGDGVRVEKSDCPTQECVHTGVIDRGGQSIVCLPARITVTLAGGAERGVDAVSG